MLYHSNTNHTPHLGNFLQNLANHSYIVNHANGNVQRIKIVINILLVGILHLQSPNYMYKIIILYSPILILLPWLVFFLTISQHRFYPDNDILNTQLPRKLTP